MLTVILRATVSVVQNLWVQMPSIYKHNTRHPHDVPRENQKVETKENIGIS
jgi:hypothetical protein